MVREWCKHRLGEERAELLAAFDRLVTAHLRIALDSFTVPDSGEPGQPPYEELPMRGRVATYTVNLLLLRAHAGQIKNGRAGFLLVEGTIGEGARGRRPWDSLAHLWRTWFPLESLGSLADVFSAHRVRDGIRIKPSSVMLTRDMGQLGLSYSVGVILADDLLAAMSGLHVAAEGAMPQREFANLRQHIEARVPELAESVDRLHRESRSADGIGREEPREYSRVSRNYLDHVELDARLMRSPRQWLERRLAGVNTRALLLGTRYTAEALAESYSKLYPGGVADFLSEPFMGRLRPREGEREEAGWSEFCAGYGAAPVLRWAVRFLSRQQCASIASDAGAALSSGDVQLADVETAAVLAVLAGLGDADDLCGQMLARIVGECRAGNWSLLDISVETWERLADLFAVGSPVVAQGTKADFITILESAITESRAVLDEKPERGGGPLALFWVHALRIGATRRQDDLIGAIVYEAAAIQALPGWQRKCLLALAGWVRERGDHRLALDIFFGHELRWVLPRVLGLSDTDTALKELEAATGRLLTYREAMDVRWVFENVPATMSATEINEIKEALPSSDSSGQGPE